MTGNQTNDPINNERKWWQKKRYLLPIGFFFLVGAISSAVEGDPPIDTQPEALALVDAIEPADDIAESTTTEAPTTTTTEAPTTTTEAPTTTTEAPTTTTEAPEPESEAVQIDCNGQPIDFFDDGSISGEQWCNDISQLALQIALRDGAPDLADRFDLVGWDAAVDAAHSFCDVLVSEGTDLGAMNDQERGLFIFAAWGATDSDLQSFVFGNDVESYAVMLGASAGVYCPSVAPGI